MYKNILLPTDGSDEAEAAVEHAKSLAEKYNSKIHILSVVNITTGVGDPSFQIKLDELQKASKEIVKSTSKAFEDNNVKTQVEIGIPYQEINEYAMNHNIDLIVMGSHGRSGLNRFFLGSITEKVLRTNPLPTLTVKKEGYLSDEE